MSGAAEKNVKWEARISDDEPGRKVAWKSIEQGTETANTLSNAGAVRFDDHGDTIINPHDKQ